MMRVGGWEEDLALLRGRKLKNFNFAYEKEGRSKVWKKIRGNCACTGQESFFKNLFVNRKLKKREIKRSL